MLPNPQETSDLVTFTEEVPNGKLHFFVQWFLHETGDLLGVATS